MPFVDFVEMCILKPLLNACRRIPLAPLLVSLFAAGLAVEFSTARAGMFPPSPQEPAETENQPPSTARIGYLIRVPLPVTEAAAATIKQQIQRVAEEAPLVVKASQRPVLILEFDTRNGSTGQGSEIGNCLNIALQLTDAKLNGLHTVAYIPQSAELGSDQPLESSHLKGHAVLIALACNEIAMHDSATIGEAGIDVSDDPALVTQLYESVASKRLVLPLPVALAMVDKSRSLFRVETNDGFQFVNQEQLTQLEQQGAVIGSRTLNEAGSLPTFSSQLMLQFRLIRHRVVSRRDLARRLNVDPATVEGDPSAGGQWQAVQLPLDGVIDARSADWTIRMLNNHLNSHETNLIIVRLNTIGGDIQASLRLARELSALDPAEFRTVAFVETTAGGASALVASGCDQWIMTRDAVIGGPGDPAISEQELSDARPLIELLAERKQADWSVPMALVDPTLSVSRWRNKQTGQVRILSPDEREQLADRDDWVLLGEVDFSMGLTGAQAEKLFLTRTTVESFDQLMTYYQLSQTPTVLQPSAMDKWIEMIARELASPWIAAWLLFGAVFLLSTEMSHPGIGIPGFLGTICLMLFFWSQYLDGNAHWLEIMLFLVGVVFLVLEIFVIPGFGVFGIGGLLMVVTAIVLATQTFIIPRNSEELAQLPVSLSMVVASGGGFVAALFVIRRYLPTMPVFRRMMLHPPSADESVSPIQRAKRESLVDRSHLLGRRGTTVSPLVPAGKARIGNDLVDVITDGRMVERGEEIEVVEVAGNRVVVQPRVGDDV